MVEGPRRVEGERPARLGYDDPRGDLALRRALQAYLARAKGLACDVEQLVIVNGSQQAIDLCARLLVDPGETVVVENPGYRMAHHVFEAAGAVLHGVDVDQQGLQTDALDKVTGRAWPTSRRRTSSRWDPSSRSAAATRCCNGPPRGTHGSSRTTTTASTASACVPKRRCSRWTSEGW